MKDKPNEAIAEKPAENVTEKTVEKVDKGKTLTVVATREQPRYRVGKVFTKIPQQFNASDFTTEQIEQLKSDPVLVVVES
jgi:hypothetical protein